MTKTIKVLVVDDHALFRRGVVELLREQPDISLVGEAGSGPEALKLSRQSKPNVVLLDVHMPGGDGVEAVRGLKQIAGLQVLMLTISEKNEDLLAAIEAGADGYLLKSAEPEELCRAIRQVAAGQSVLSPEITAKVMHGKISAMYVTPTETGTFEEDPNLRVQCAELCGTGHPLMNMEVVVLEPAQFEEWLTEAEMLTSNQ